MVAGGAESISLVQNNANYKFYTDEWLLRHEADLYMPMIETADLVARRYGVSREAQDEYALQSQQRTAAAQAAGRFDAEIVPLPAWKTEENKETGEVTEVFIDLDKGRGESPRHDARGSRETQRRGSRRPKSTITAGNSSQLSDGAAALVLMELRLRRAARPDSRSRIYRGMASRAQAR